MRYSFFILVFLVPYVSQAQLTAPGANAIRYTSYPSAPGVKDPVFIFCNASGTQQGTIKAVSPRGTGLYDFSWYKWSDITKSFSTLLKTDTVVQTSSFTDLDEGGYKVHISDGAGFDTNLVGWIFIDKPYAEAKLNFYDCDRVILYGKAVIDTFYYKDINTGASIKLINSINLSWSSNPASVIVSLFPLTQFPDLYRPTKLPYENVTYKINAVDDFVCGSESSFSYQSIHVKADYSVEPDKGEAPLETNFTDKSIRASVYKWDFGDGTSSNDSTVGTHIYYKPGTYYPKLTVKSSLSCIDSVQIDSVVVERSKLSIPNVFTPNGDGINDFYIVESKSLRSINVEIFSRSGLMVYSFYGEGERLRAWKGWDGNVNNSSIKASPGVYFFIIRAAGWDNVIYDSKEYRGFLYLYR